MRKLGGVALVLGTMIVFSLYAHAQQQSPTINDDYFSPVPINVNLGDSVTWTHKGDHPHSVTADGAFDSTDADKQCTAIIGGDGCLSNGDQFTVTFNAAGTFSYHCRVHGSAMVGSVVVQSASTTTTSSTTTTVPTSTSETSTSLASDQPTAATQASLPSLPSASGVARPKAMIRSRNEDDQRPWVLAAVAIAGATTIAGIVLVRRGRVPFG